eukprot:3900541-Rhodomonas_salina.1
MPQRSAVGEAGFRIQSAGLVAATNQRRSDRLGSTYVPEGFNVMFPSPVAAGSRVTVAHPREGECDTTSRTCVALGALSVTGSNAIAI